MRIEVETLSNIPKSLYGGACTINEKKKSKYVKGKS
jgi:hypothetical protein